MIGTDITGKGGIAAVVRGYQSSGLFGNLKVTYVATHCDGGTIAKAGAALTGWCRVGWAMVWMPAPLLHIHAASRVSFWRKYVTCLIARTFRRPYILHIHGGEFLKFFSDECRPEMQSIIRNAFRRAAKILALSEQWRLDLLKICPDATIEILPNAVLLPDLATRSESASPGNDIRILSVGQLRRRKGTYDLVNAFAAIASLFPNARLICAGDGDAAPFHKLAADLGITGRVEFPGWVGAEKCGELYSSASIFALPSYAEGLPMALLEAMSWRLAVVTCPVGGIPEAVKDGENGLLVNPGNVDALSRALKILLSDPAYRARLASAARETIEKKYSLAATVVRLGEIYSSFGVSVKPAA